MLNVGLTGGIASGKSTVARMFQEKGAYLIDFDLMTREAQSPCQPAWKAIVQWCGPEILKDDSSIDRSKLGSLVFQDQAKLKRLNEIVHPLLFEEWERRVRLIGEKDPRAIVVSDIPLLIEVGAHSRVDAVVLVYIPPAQQLVRMRARNGLSREEILRRIDAQLPLDDKIPYADYVIDNSASLDATRRRVEEVWLELTRREGEQCGPAPLKFS